MKNKTNNQSQNIPKKYSYYETTKTCIEDPNGEFDTQEECINTYKNITPSPTITPSPRPTIMYGCDQDKCVQSEYGIFSTSNCDNSCRSIINVSDRLKLGEYLSDNKYIESSNKQYRLIMKGNGIAVISQSPFLDQSQYPNTLIKAGNTGGKLRMRNDGNFVMERDNGEVVWQSNTIGQGDYVSINDDGQVKVFSKYGTEMYPNPPKPEQVTISILENQRLSRDWSGYGKVEIGYAVYGCLDTGSNSFGTRYIYVINELQQYINSNNKNFTIEPNKYNEIFKYDPAYGCVKTLQFRANLYKK